MDIDTIKQYNHGIEMCLTKWITKINDNPNLERDDIRQETFVKLLRADINGSFRNECSLTTWAYKLCDNAIKSLVTRYDHHRLDYRKRRWYGEDLWEDAQDINQYPLILEKLLSESLEDLIIKEDDTQLVLRCIELLPEKQKKCTELLLEGHSYATIAEEVGCPLGTAQSAIFRSKAFLKAEIGAIESAQQPS